MSTGTAFWPTLGAHESQLTWICCFVWRALLGGFLCQMKTSTFQAWLNARMPTPTGLPWHHDRVLRRLRIHTLLQEIVHCSIGPEFWGIRVHPFFWEKNLQIYKLSCGTAFSAKYKGWAFLSQRNPGRFGRPALFGQQLESLKVSKSAPPSGCCKGNHEVQECKTEMFKLNKFIFQSSDLEDW